MNNAMAKRRLFNGLVMVTLSFSAWGAQLPEQNSPGLMLSIETSKPLVQRAEGLAFTIMFKNNSPTNLLLNGGELLGNGAQIWSSLAAELKSENGQTIPIRLSWGVPGVAGRVYFLGVPLRPGSSYRLPVNARDYLVGTGERLAPGKYALRCVYRGRQSSHRDLTQMPGCWEGELHSNVLRFEVLPD